MLWYVYIIDMYLLRHSCEYIRSFWRYNDVEYNQGLMGPQNDCLFFVKVKCNNLLSSKTC